MNFDDNITLADDGVSTICSHCSERLGDARTNALEHALGSERESSELGPGIRADPKLFADRKIVLRQLFCPKCLTVLATEVVPQDEGRLRGWKVFS
ncbi:Acetone carboxylase gamma subunit OS=Eoetvoesiella caeni OX=645616 GN=DFR37_10231 PE=4 SV=1 [Eoetvoesiella caeni]